MPGKLPKDPKTPKLKNKKVVSEKRDPETGYGMSSRTNMSRATGHKKAVGKIRKQKTTDMVNETIHNQYGRAAATQNILKIGK